MRWIQRDQTPQKSKMDQPAVTGIPIQKKLPDQKSGALPSNDVRVRYQPTPVSPTGGGVIQCCGFGDMLRSFFCCCCDDEDIRDGPCASYALSQLGWDPNYKVNRMNRIQNESFEALGTQMIAGYELSELKDKKVLVEFFNNILPYAFHVMYTDGNGHLRGINNDTFMLNRVLGTPVSTKETVFVAHRETGVSTKEPAFVADRATGECIFKMDGLTVRNDVDGYVSCIKYVTQEEYLSKYPPSC